MEIKNQLNKQSVSQQVIDHIIDQISKGALKSGDRLMNEREMAEAFGISRVPLREAVRALNVLGVLESRQGEGTFIGSYSPDILGKTIFIQSVLTNTSTAQIFETRSLMEAEAARLAARNATEEEIAEIEKIEIQREKAIEEPSKADYEAMAFYTDNSFHRSIAKATHNSYFLLYMDGLFYSVREIHKEAAIIPEIMEVATTFHRMISYAIKSRNEQLAYNLMYSHIAEIYKALIRLKPNI